jgi:hypothetical protein
MRRRILEVIWIKFEIKTWLKLKMRIRLGYSFQCPPKRRMMNEEELI